MPEIDPLVLSYSHLADFPRAKEALHTLKRIASLVKPLMRARGWKVGRLAEFYPSQKNLLGMNENRGQNIFLRLRYPGDRNQFLPVEQVADTMLHELAHIIFGPHDSKFHALWNQLRDEHLSLTMKGYTGEGFLSEGHRLGGRTIPLTEARRLARNAVDKRRTLDTGSGQRLGGVPARPGQDIRRVIADAVERRDNSLRGCANTNQTQGEIVEIADTAIRNGFSTKADEDTANDAAIAQALWEMIEEEEMAKHGGAYVPMGAVNNSSNWGSSTVRGGSSAPAQSRHGLQYDASNRWICPVCTLHNPANYLCCDACGMERGEGLASRSRTVIDLTGSRSPDHSRARRPAPSNSTRSKGKEVRRVAPQPTVPAPRTWTCNFCGRQRETQWWSCDLCGTVKASS